MRQLMALIFYDFYCILSLYSFQSLDEEPSMNASEKVLQVLRNKSNQWSEIQPLASGLGIHRSTLYRVLKEMQARGADIEWKCPPGKRGAIRLVKGPKGEETVPYKTGLALSVAALVMRSAGTDVWAENLGALQDLAKSRMTKRELRMVEGLAHRLMVKGTVSDSRPLPEEVLENVLYALGSATDPFELDLTYQKDNPSEVKEYRIVPYKLIQDTWSGGAYLLAWVPVYGEVRTFKVERMLSARALNKPGFIPNPEQLERHAQYFMGGWTGSGEPTTYEVHILSKPWAHVLQETEPDLPDLNFDILDDKTIVVRFKAMNETAPLRWVLQFGSSARVLNPISFRDRVREELQRAAGLYPADP